jgi:hypothetical protein
MKLHLADIALKPSQESAAIEILSKYLTNYHIEIKDFDRFKKNVLVKVYEDNYLYVMLKSDCILFYCPEILLKAINALIMEYALSRQNQLKCRFKALLSVKIYSLYKDAEKFGDSLILSSYLMKERVDHDNFVDELTDLHEIEV